VRAALEDGLDQMSPATSESHLISATLWYRHGFPKNLRRTLILCFMQAYMLADPRLMKYPG